MSKSFLLLKSNEFEITSTIFKSKTNGPLLPWESATKGLD